MGAIYGAAASSSSRYLVLSSRCTPPTTSSLPPRRLRTWPSPLRISSGQTSYLATAVNSTPIASTKPPSFPLSILPNRHSPARVQLSPNLASLIQTRSHVGHSHSHHHHSHDNTYLTSTNKKDAGVRITRIGLYVNLAMAISKGIGGYVFHSQALLADAIHALTDLVSDIMTLATVSFSLKPPSNRFPTGFGKVESLGALGVSSLLLTGGILMGWNALEVLYGQFMLDPSAAAEHAAHGHGHGHGHSHSHADLGPNINAAWIAAGSIVVKEYLYRATIKIARERKSSVLASNAVHHRIDSSSSVVALLAIGGSKVLSNATWLDPVGGLIVSLMVVRAGYGNTTMALMELADTAVDTDIKDSVRRAATKALSPGGSDPASVVEGAAQIEIRDVQGVKAGQNYLMEVELSVPGDWSLHQTRKIEEAVRQRIGATVRGVKRVKVRFVPAGTDATEFADEFISVDVSPRTSPEPEAGPQHQHSNGLDTLSGSPTEKKDR